MDVHIETAIDAPADKVWNILAHQFADIADWASAVKWSKEATADEAPADFALAPSAPIAGRTTDAGIVATEFFTEFDDAAKRFTFRAAGLPRIVKLTQNTSTVRPTGDASCVISFDIHLELMGPFKVLTPLLRRRLAKGLSPVQQDLKIFAETDQISPAAQAAQTR